MESGARESNDQSAAPAAPSSRAVQFDLDRTISLSDGIFAFALTLLVLSITVPVFPGGGRANGRAGCRGAQGPDT